MTELLAGTTLGTAAAISPGPLQTLIISSTLSRGFGAGWRVAVAPLVTDPLVIAVSLAIVASLPDRFVNGLAVAGGVTIVASGLWTLRGTRESSGEPSTTDLWMGVLVNLFSPHPWLYWVGAGAPLLLVAWQDDPWRAGAFLLAFYGALVGGKVAIAGGVAASGRRLPAKWRHRLVVTSAGLLMGFGVFIAVSGMAGRF